MLRKNNFGKEDSKTYLSKNTLNSGIDTRNGRLICADEMRVLNLSLINQIDLSLSKIEKEEFRGIAFKCQFQNLLERKHFELMCLLQ